MQLVLGDHRPPWGDLHHLRALGIGIVSQQRLLTTGARLGLERNHHVNVFHRHQRPGLPLVTRLSTRAAPTGLATRSLALRRITRGWTRRRARVLLQALHQFLHGGLEGCHTGFKRQNIVLDFARGAIPKFGRYRWMSCHEAIIRHQQRIGQDYFGNLNGYP
jgi:hypothetical protein